MVGSDVEEAEVADNGQWSVMSHSSFGNFFNFPAAQHAGSPSVHSNDFPSKGISEHSAI